MSASLITDSMSFRRNSLSRRRALTPNPSSAGLRYRPPTPYYGPSNLASPASSYGGNSLNMTGMDAALPPLMSPSPAFTTPFASPYSDGGGQGYIPPPAEDFPDDFDGFDDYEGDSGYGPYGGNFQRGYGNSGFAGGSGGSAYGGYGGMGGGGGVRRGGMGMDGFRGAGAGLRNPGLGYGGGALGPELDNDVGFMNTGVGSFSGSTVNSSNVVYDPVLGPGIQGTYYPKVAQMQRLGQGLNGGAYGYPGASVGLPPPPGTYSSSPRRGLRRSRSFF